MSSDSMVTDIRGPGIAEIATDGKEGGKKYPSANRAMQSSAHESSAKYTCIKNFLKNIWGLHISYL